MTNEQRNIIERTIGGIKIANSRKAITDDYAELFINDLRQALNIADVMQRSELLLAFVSFYNERHPEKYIPNSEIGKFNIASNSA